MLSRTDELDARLFQNSAYIWRVSIKRTVTLPPDPPVFNEPEDVVAYFSRAKREYTVLDENVGANAEKYPTFMRAWSAYCQLVHKYAKFFPMLRKVGNLYQTRNDLPNHSAVEP